MRFTLCLPVVLCLLAGTAYAQPPEYASDGPPDDKAVAPLDQPNVTNRLPVGRTTDSRPSSPASRSAGLNANSAVGQAPFPRTEESDVPRAELFGGFTYQHRQNGADLTGWNAAVAMNFNRIIGVVFDTAKQSPDAAFLSSPDTANRYSFLAGPQVSFRGERLTCFVRGLAGAHYFTGQPRINGGWNFAYGFGGGVDVGLTDLFAVRPVQYDYIIIDGRDSHLSAHRVSIGAVVRF